MCERQRFPLAAPYGGLSPSPFGCPQEKRLTAEKRRLKEKRMELHELNEEYRLLKKLKKGKMSDVRPPLSPASSSPSFPPRPLPPALSLSSRLSCVPRASPASPMVRC